MRGGFVAPVAVAEGDFDGQGHLNNASVARLLNTGRVEWIRAGVGPRWGEFLRDEGLAVVVRELHVRYDREGLPGMRFAVATRARHRQGRAGILDQAVLDRASGTELAVAWVVQLLVKRGAAVPWPEWYWDAMSALQGERVPVVPPVVPPAHRAPWGPP